MKLSDIFRRKQEQAHTQARQQRHARQLNSLPDGQSLYSKDQRTKWTKVAGTIYIKQLVNGRWTFVGYNEPDDS
jgi:hypothetical protein